MRSSSSVWRLSLLVIATIFAFSIAFHSNITGAKHTSKGLQNRSSTEKKLGSLMGNLFGKMDPTGVPIIDAVIDNNEQEIRKYLSASEINKIDSKQNTAMHVIAKLGHYKYPPAAVPTLLIDSGININAKNGDGLTALEISLLSGWQKIAYLLLDRGADKSVVTQSTVSRITCPDCKKVVREYQLAQSK